MTLRQKTLLIVGLAISLFSLTLVFFANTILLGGFSQVERTEAEANISRAINAVSAEVDSLDIFLADWTVWDDSYQFAAAPDPEYIKKSNDAKLPIQYIDAAGSAKVYKENQSFLEKLWKTLNLPTQK